VFLYDTLGAFVNFFNGIETAGIVFGTHPMEKEIMIAAWEMQLVFSLAKIASA